MPDWRRIATEARFILERHKREVDLVTSYLQEASVLLLVFGLLDTYATRRLDWTVAKFVVSIAFVLFAAALATPWMVYQCLRGILIAGLDWSIYWVEDKIMAISWTVALIVGTCAAVFLLVVLKIAIQELSSRPSQLVLGDFEQYHSDDASEQHRGVAYKHIPA